MPHRRSATDTQSAAHGELQFIDPFSCRMWELHDRLTEFLTERTCKEVIDSFLKDGQKHPVLARPCKPGDDSKYELIYGARRLFAARHLSVDLLARIRDIDDRRAFIEMDIENRVRDDISPYERGMSFKAWLRSGHFDSQEDLARTLGLSPAQISRTMKFADLPAGVVMAFPDPRNIREAWAVALAERCADPNVKSDMLEVARGLRSKANAALDAKKVYALLLDCTDRSRRSRICRRDDVVRSARGRALFRVSYRHNDLHIIIGRDLAPTQVVDELKLFLRELLDDQNGQGLPDQPPRMTFDFRRNRQRVSS